MKILCLVLFFLPLYAQAQLNISNNGSASGAPHIVTFKSISYILWTDNEGGTNGIQFRLCADGNWSEVKKINASYHISPSSTCMEDSTVLDLLWIEGSGINNRLMYGRIIDSALVDSIEIFRNDSLAIIFSSCLFDQPAGTLHISWDAYFGDSVYTYYSYKDIGGISPVKNVIITNNINGGYPRAQLAKDKNQDVLCLWCSGPQFSPDSMGINMIRKNGGAWIAGTRLTALEGIGRDFVAKNDDSLNIHIVSLPGMLPTCPCNGLLYSKWDGSQWSIPEAVPRDERMAYSTQQLSPDICFSKDCHPIVAWEQYSWDMFLNLYAKFIGTSVKTDAGWHVNAIIASHPNLEAPGIAVDHQDFINYVWQDTSDGDYDVYLYKTTLLAKVEQERNPNIPDKISLDQNYPNPFNPSTVIKYYIPERSHVVLSVYDLSGRLVSTLVDGQKEAGRYQIDYNGINLSSGTYICRLVVGTRSVAGKMILIK